MTNPRDAQTAPEPIIMVDGDKVFGPGKAPDSYVRYMIDDSRFPAWHGCMTHYDRAATPARARMGAVDVAYAAGWCDACIGKQYGTQKPTPEQAANLADMEKLK